MRAEKGGGSKREERDQGGGKVGMKVHVGCRQR